VTSPDTSAVAGGDSLTPRVTGTVRVVGAGLLGASVGHALRALGVDVVLEDASPSQTAPDALPRPPTSPRSSSSRFRRMSSPTSSSGNCARSRAPS